MGFRDGRLVIRVVGDAKSFNKTVDGLQKTVKGIGSKLKLGFAAAGGLAAAGLGIGLLEGLKREKLQDRLQGQLALTDQQAAQAGRVAASVYAQAWGDSLDQSFEAVKVVGQQLEDLGSVSDTELERITAGVLAVADTFDQDLTQVISAVRSMIANGLARDSAEALDVITRGFQEGVDKGSDLLDTLVEYAEPFRSIGIDGAEAVGLLNAGLEAGAFNADKVGDAIKEFSIRAIEDSGDVVDAYKSLNLSAEALQSAIAGGGPAARDAMTDIILALRNLEDPLERERAGVALFGTMWEDLGEQVILALDPTIAKMDEVAGATDRMAEAVGDNAATKFESFKRRAGVALGEFVATNVLPFANDVLDAFDENGAGGAFNLLKEKFEETWPIVMDWLRNVALPAIIDWVILVATEVGKAAPQIGQAIGEGIAKGIRDALPDASLPGLNDILRSIPGAPRGGGLAPPAPARIDPDRARARNTIVQVAPGAVQITARNDRDAGKVAVDELRRLSLEAAG